MKSALFFVILIVFVSCTVVKKNSYNPSKKFSSTQLQQDFSTLQKVLKANHPGLYWYSSPDSVDSYFSDTENALQDSLTEAAFRNKISWAISKIHCGHTTVRASQAYSDYFRRKRLPQFPLSLKVWNDTAVVISNLLQSVSDSANEIKRGTVVTGINGSSIKEILDSMCAFIGTDGYSENFKYQIISFNFPAYFRAIYGVDSIYTVRYLDSLAQSKVTRIKNFEFKRDSVFAGKQLVSNDEQPKELRKLKLQNERNLVIDTTLNSALLSVNTFSEGNLNRFFRKSFKTINEKNIENVILDLRLNSGGHVLSATKLCQYLLDQPFRVADTVAAFNRDLQYKEHIKPWFIYWLSMHISGKKYSDGRIHFKFFENHFFKPKKKNHFNGNLYVLTGGYTFSAATMVAGKLKSQKNVTIVGEETGGAAYGNSAMFLTTIVLPNTGIRVTLPLYRMVLNAALPKNGRGVLPDVKVGPSTNGIRIGVDAKLEKVKELIRNNKAAAYSRIEAP